jgi:hypothetical protein
VTVAGWNASAGQSAELPVQVSARSQSPARYRQELWIERDQAAVFPRFAFGVTSGFVSA